MRPHAWTANDCCCCRCCCHTVCEGCCRAIVVVAPAVVVIVVVAVVAAAFVIVAAAVAAVVAVDIHQYTFTCTEGSKSKPNKAVAAVAAAVVSVAECCGATFPLRVGQSCNNSNDNEKKQVKAKQS